MNKNFLISIGIVLVLILAGCKNSEDPLIEKKACYKECMLVENDQTYCLDDCGMEETDLEAKKDVCGDGVCQTAEKDSDLCPADCNGCTVEADCGVKEICKEGSCSPVDCKINSDCPTNMECTEYSCVKVETLDTDAIEEMQVNIESLQSDMQTMLDDIIGLSDSLDAADASDDDKDVIQEDIDVLDTTVTQLNTYNSTLTGYLDDLDSVETNAGIATVGNAFNITKEKVEAYMELWQSTIDDIQDDIDALEPTTKSDLIIHDFELHDVDGQEGIFTITIQNDDEGNITSSQTFRMQLTSYDVDNETNDDSRETISSGLNPDDELDVEMAVEIPDLEDYFTDHSNATSLVLKFLVELDIDDNINESDETNNNETFNVTFDREDYVSNSAPVAAISANATSVLVNDTISFSGAGSTDSDGTISSYSWDFGDTYSSTSSTPTHSYTTAGTYPVILTVTDNDGATDTETVSITVT
ncbi:MAG: PKD domain-containing protein [Candidatus Woesearchaeota archaeon]|jgi:hypothetical protein